MEGEILDQQSHDSSCEEEAKSVLQAERKFILTTCAMFLHISDEMENKGE